MLTSSRSARPGPGDSITQSISFSSSKFRYVARSRVSACTITTFSAMLSWFCLLSASSCLELVCRGSSVPRGGYSVENNVKRFAVYESRKSRMSVRGHGGGSVGPWISDTVLSDIVARLGYLGLSYRGLCRWWQCRSQAVSLQLHADVDAKREAREKTPNEVVSIARLFLARVT